MTAVLAALGATLLAAAAAAAPTPKPSPAPVNPVLLEAINPPAYLKRGDEVEKSYQRYTARLRETHDALAKALVQDAPELLKRLSPEEPKPVRYGYQVLPRVVPDPPLKADPSHPSRAASNSYSWPKTEKFIEWQLSKIDETGQKLSVLPKMKKEDRAPVLRKMLEDELVLESDQRTIDHHVQYNRFWQSAIAQDRPRFDRLTEIHDLVVARQKLRDRGPLDDDARIIDKNYSERIESLNDRVSVPGFVKLKTPREHVSEIEVPLYTDITDSGFLARVKKAIESQWLVESREDTFRLRLSIKQVRPAKLYAPVSPPSRGDHIDVAEHVKRFPKDGGVLTTGANSIYAVPGSYIALGPQDLAPNVIAHEFGHILGFVDTYLRGYRDLGADGFEVLEIVPDDLDIMSSSGHGKATRAHYEKIITALKREREQAPSPHPREGVPREENHRLEE